MKIYILNVPELLQPKEQAIRYPSHNKMYDAEQDFLLWLKKQHAIITDDPSIADWHYLPVYWTRWHINHEFSMNTEARDLLKREVDKIIINDTKTFTIVLFDGGPLIDVGETIIFNGNRTTNPAIDIPLISSRHLKPPLPVKKKYLASFNGSFETHPIRMEMAGRFQNNPEILVQKHIPTRFYKRWLWAKNYNLNTMSSYIALAPRGSGCSSFRFFEAMQLGVAPCLIGDIDVRPFKKFIPWDNISYYASDIDDLELLLNNLDKKEAIDKGKNACHYWKNELNYQKWCKYVLMELNDIKQ